MIVFVHMEIIINQQNQILQNKQHLATDYLMRNEIRGDIKFRYIN